ncbi:gluconate kinase [Bifidobacterium sp. B14384H11]|nr:FGGY family carbohydrate kinase [Bifidobacterium choladohabitans]MBI0047506.1 gluconate kinase [Bifidobacterium choladohabitans]
MAGMTYTAAFDVGTTQVKAVLVDDQGSVRVCASSGLLPIDTGDGRIEQNPEDWLQAFIEVSRDLLARAGRSIKHFRSDQVTGIIMSGQMQDLIALDAQGQPVGPAILYADGRAEEESAELVEAYGAGSFRARVGNPCDGSLPVAKLIWMSRHQPQRYAQVRHVLIDAKDYLIWWLTGVYCGDVTACSTAGAMDLRSRTWRRDILEAAGVDAAIFPELHWPWEGVGTSTPGASAATGFAPGTTVYAGMGDAGASTLAGGVFHPGQFNINLGTSGWIATVTNRAVADRPGMVNLAYLGTDSIINTVPFLNAGNVHAWATGVFAGGGPTEGDDDPYRRMGHLLESSPAGARGVICLPYLVGERFPMMNPSIRGAYVGISFQATASDLARAALEGVSYSIRQGLDLLGMPIERVTLIGGGTRETQWCQILADILDATVQVLDDAHLMPAAALAELVSVGKRTGSSSRPDLQALEELVEANLVGRVYSPDDANRHVYDAGYNRFRRLYPALDSLR